MPDADSITAAGDAVGNMDIMQFVILAGIVVYFIWAKLVARKNGGSKPPVMAPNGIAAMKEDIGELKTWTISHTEKFDDFVINSTKEDTLHTERLNTLKERIDRIEDGH